MSDCNVYWYVAVMTIMLHANVLLLIDNNTTENPVAEFEAILQEEEGMHTQCEL